METCDAVILAGGLGTRIRHLAPDLPKPMIPVAGKPFLQWVLLQLAGCGFRNLTVSCGYKAGVIADFIGQLRWDGVRVAAIAEESPLGTGGGFLHAIDKSTASSWLVCNGDSIVLTDIAAFVEAVPPSAGAAILAVRNEDDRYGRLGVGPDGVLQSFDEKRAGAGPINAGVYLFRRAALSHFPRTMPLSLERDVFPALLAQGVPVSVSVVDAPFIDVGTEESLQSANAFIMSNQEWFVDLPHL